MTQMPKFLLFVCVGVLFDGAFSLWVSLNYLEKIQCSLVSSNKPLLIINWCWHTYMFTFSRTMYLFKTNLCGLHSILRAQNIACVNCCTCTYIFPKLTGYYRAPGSSADLLCGSWVLVVDHCIFFQSNNGLRENVMVCCRYLAVIYIIDQWKWYKTILLFFECCENFKRMFNLFCTKIAQAQSC